MKSHMAVHFTDSTTPRIVIQPRNKFGQFRAPIRRFINANVTTMHVTVNGEVVRSINNGD